MRCNKINRLIYQNLESKFPKEIKVVGILCYAVYGLTLFDLSRISLMYTQTSRKMHNDEDNFGDWQKMLSKEEDQLSDYNLSIDA